MKILLGQALRFTIVGVILMAIDAGIFGILHAFGVPVTPANVTSRACAALASFWLNGRFSFANHGEPTAHHIRFGRYLTWWLLMTLTSTVSLNLVKFALPPESVYAAKPIIEFVLAVISFFVARHWIYA